MCVAFWSAFPVSIFQPRSLVAQSTWKRGKRSSQKICITCWLNQKALGHPSQIWTPKNVFFFYFASRRTFRGGNVDKKSACLTAEWCEARVFTKITSRTSSALRLQSMVSSQDKPMPSTSTAVGQRTSSSVKFWNASEMKFPRENCENCFF